MLMHAFAAALTEYLAVAYGWGPLPDLDQAPPEIAPVLRMRKATLDLVCDIIDSMMTPTTTLVLPPEG